MGEEETEEELPGLGTSGHSTPVTWGSSLFSTNPVESLKENKLLQTPTTHETSKQQHPEELAGPITNSLQL